MAGLRARLIRPLGWGILGRSVAWTRGFKPRWVGPANILRDTFWCLFDLRMFILGGNLFTGGVGVGFGVGRAGVWARLTRLQKAIGCLLSVVMRPRSFDERIFTPLFSLTSPSIHSHSHVRVFTTQHHLSWSKCF